MQISKIATIFLISLLLCLIMAQTQANEFNVKDVQSLYQISQITYQSNDGEIKLSCDYWQIDNTRPNWEVYCGKKHPQIKKEFLIHFAIRIHNKNIEIQFWLTDRQTPHKPAFHSSSAWISSSEAPKNIRLSLGVENDYASLYLDAKPK